MSRETKQSGAAANQTAAKFDGGFKKHTPPSLSGNGANTWNKHAAKARPQNLQIIFEIR